VKFKDFKESTPILILVDLLWKEVRYLHLVQKLQLILLTILTFIVPIFIM
jgi:hypothetical protein